jgi:hypothetical protein
MTGGDAIPQTLPYYFGESGVDILVDAPLLIIKGG